MLIEVSLLAIALFEASKKLFAIGFEKGVVEPVAEKWFEPFQKWLTRGYDAKKADADLRKAFITAIQNTGAPEKDEAGLIGWLKSVRLDQLQAPKNGALRRQVAAALVGLTGEGAPPPEDLVVALGWPRSRTEELAQLLANLRRGLAGTYWQPLLDYANQAEVRGLLRGALDRLALISNAITSTSEGDALRVVIVDRLKLSEAEAWRIEENYRSLVAAEFRMHIIQGLVQVEKAVRLPLQDIYLELSLRPLTAQREQDEELAALLKAGNAERLERSLRETDQRVSGALDENQQLVIVGKPGSGKTMSLKFIAFMLAMGEAGAARLGLNAPYLPLYLRLAQFAQALQARPTLSLEAYFHQYLRDKYPSILRGEEFLSAALQNGACMVLLDGLDEVGDVGERLARGQTLRQLVLHEVQRFANQRCGAGCGNRLVVTSRLEGYHRGELPGFAEAELGFLRLPDEVESFLLRWYTAYIQEHDAKLSFDAAEAQARASVEKIMISISRSDSVKLLAINPLLLTILAVISENLHTPLPNRRAELYRIVAETMVKNWRRAQTDIESRIYRSSLSASDIYYLMASLAYWLHEKKPGGTMSLGDWREKLSALLADYGEEREIRELVDELIHHATEEAGLLTERSPGEIGFFHLTLEEYLAAVEIARQNGSQQLEMVKNHWQDAYWQEVLLLTAGELEQRGNRDALAAYLTHFLNFDPSAPNQAGRNVYLAGRALADIGSRSVGANPQRMIKRALRCVAQDLDFDCEKPNQLAVFPPALRADCADTLDELGYTPEDLSAFVPVSEPGGPGFLIARYPVTNAQYARFLKPENFQNWVYWCDFPMLAENSLSIGRKTWGRTGWDWLQKELSDKDNPVEDGVLAPRYWRDPRFGSLRPSAPVVGVSWYEANAYCRWLLAHWEELEEGRLGLPKPGGIRLPSRREWVAAAGGEQPGERFPWDRVGEANTTQKDDLATIAGVVLRANVNPSGIGRTTPVWMYPQGESQPYRLRDLGGNVWEWQANYSDKDRNTVGLSGGSWSNHWVDARVSERFGDLPFNRLNFIGFRVVALPSVS